MGLKFKIRFTAQGSSPANSLSWFVDNISVYRICDAPLQLDGNPYWNTDDDKGIEIDWQAPEAAINPGFNWIHWDNGINDDGIGLNQGGDFSVAIRWDENQLIDYEGDTLSSIRFFLADSGFSEIIAKIWTGNHAEHLIFSKTVTSPAIHAWTEIPIDTLLLLDASLEYWVGYRILGQLSGSFPVGIDNSPPHPQQGWMVSMNEITWDEAGTWSDYFNWNIHLKLIDEDTSSDCAGFNVYRKIDEENEYSLIGFAPNKIVQAEHFYQDSTVGNGIQACYRVNALWSHGNDTCVSDFALNIPGTEDHVCVLASGIPGFNADKRLSIYPNPATNQINICSKDGQSIDEISIYNPTGQKVFQGKSHDHVIDISKLPSGMYVVEVVIGQNKIREKLIVE